MNLLREDSMNFTKIPYSKLVMTFILGTMFSCGGGGSSGGSSSDTSFEEESLPIVEPVITAVDKGVLFEASSENQKLSVFIKDAILLEGNGTVVRSLTNEGNEGTIKVASSAPQTVDITFHDPDVYDVILYSGINIDGTTLSSSGITYTYSNATAVNTTRFGFNPYFKITKDSTNNATYQIEFDSLPEGTTKTLTIGGWDNLYEGISFNVTMRVNSMPTMGFSGTTTCPVYYNSSTGKLEVPTKDGSGNPYTSSYCLHYTVYGGTDDVSDKETTTLKIFEGTETTPSFTDSLGILDEPHSGTYTLSSTLSPGSETSVTFLFTQDLMGDPSKQDTKTITRAVYAANDTATMDYCITTNLSATGCTVGAQGDPYGTKLSDEFVYEGGFDTDGDGSDDYARYFRDTDGDGIHDDDEDVVLVKIDTGGIILPSTGGKVFLRTASYSGTGGVFSIYIYNNGSYVTSYSAGTLPTWQHIYDATTATSCTTGWDIISVKTYKDFDGYESMIAPVLNTVPICRNTPAS